MGEDRKKQRSKMKLRRTFLYILSVLFFSITTANAIEIGSEFTFDFLAGDVMIDESDSNGYPFDCRIGFGYSALFNRYHMKVDGALLCSITELMNHEITDTIGAHYNETMQIYTPIYGKRTYRSIFVSGNIVPCFTMFNIYAGLGISVHYIDMRFDDKIGDPEHILNIHPLISLGYSWKFVQLGFYMDDFIQRMGIQFKVNLLTIRKCIASDH